MGVRFNIVFGRPSSSPDPVQLQCSADVARVLAYGLSDLGHEVRFRQELQKDSVNIIFGYHLLGGARLPHDYTCIIYQLEQLLDKEDFFLLFRRTLESASAVWDFSEQNIAFLAERGIRAIYKPIGFHPRLARIDHREQKDVDVLFYGSENDRRERILSELGKMYNVKTLFGVYGERRDAWISRSKIVLGIHFYESKLFDEVRTTFLMNNRAFTILEDTPFKKHAEFLVYAPYDKLVETCAHYLENPGLLEWKAEEAYEGFRQHPETEFLSRALSQC